VPVGAQTHRPTWLRRAAVLRRNGCQHPTGPPRGEYYPRGRSPGGEAQSDHGPGARAGTDSAAPGTRIRGACTGVAIVHRRSASGGGRPVPRDTWELDTRGVSMPPPIGHRPGRTQPNLALRGAAQSARHQGEQEQLGSPRGGLAHRHRPKEGWAAFLSGCSTETDNMPIQNHPIAGKARQTMSQGSPVGEFPPRKETPKSTHARRRPGEDAPRDKHEVCDRKLSFPLQSPRGNTHASPSYPLHTPSVPLQTLRKHRLRHSERALTNPSLRAHGASLSGGRSKLLTPP